MKEVFKDSFLSVYLEGHSAIDFDFVKLNKAMRRAGNDVRNEARRLLSRKAISQAGEVPGQRTGRLKRSIQVLGSGPGWVRVGPKKTSGMKEFYPAFLYYGVTGRPRRKDHKAQVKDGKWRIAPRANYMALALANKRAHVRGVIRSALLSSLKPR